MVFSVLVFQALATGRLAAGQAPEPEPWVGAYDPDNLHVNSSRQGVVYVNGEDIVSPPISPISPQ